MECILCNSACDYFNEVRKSFVCKNCGLVFSKSNDEYHPEITHKNKMISLIQNTFSKILSQHYLKYLSEKTDMKFNTALDIGCGFGSFVNLLNHNEVESYGIESDINTVKKANNRRVKNITFDESYSDTTYDLICIHQALYYFDNSINILEKVKSMLNDNGIIFISTVNMDSKVRKKYKLWTQGCKMCLSVNNFNSLHDLKMLDCTSYTDNFFKDYLMTKNNDMSQITFVIRALLYLFRIKKLCVYQKNGLNHFIILKKK